MSIEYDLHIQESTKVPVESWESVVQELITGKEICAFWEEHNLNQDTSFSELWAHTDFILWMYHLKRDYWMNCEEIMREISYSERSHNLIDILALLSKWVEKKENFALSSSRVFAGNILPLWKKLGLSDLIVEWLIEWNIHESIRRTKDKIGMLLKILICILYDIQIHGVYDDTPLFWHFHFAQLFEEKIDEIKRKNPSAKIMTYNWWAHSMTQAFEWVQKVFGREFQLSDLSFAPNLQRKYGDTFISIDLVDQFWPNNNSSHYSSLRQEATHGNDITITQHSNNQTALIFPKRDRISSTTRDMAEHIDTVVRSQ